MPKPFTDQEKTIIGRRLLEHGYKHFSTYGLAKTNVEEIARAAGISKGAFYKFYSSKEELFWTVIEQAEMHVREQILAVIDRPGRSPRARLVAILQKAFGLFEAFPILKLLTSGDYELLFRGVPPERLGGHLANDRTFIEQLISRCRGAGIPIRVDADALMSTLYPLVITALHREDLSLNGFSGDIDLLLELVAAYSLGEIKIRPPALARSLPARKKESQYEPVY